MSTNEAIGGFAIVPTNDLAAFCAIVSGACMNLRSAHPTACLSASAGRRVWLARVKIGSPYPARNKRKLTVASERTSIHFREVSQEFRLGDFMAAALGQGKNSLGGHILRGEKAIAIQL